MHSNRDFDEILVDPYYEPLLWFMITNVGFLYLKSTVTIWHYINVNV